MVQKKDLDYATIGGGCFWCIEAVFSKLYGIKSAISGFAGGQLKNPTYRDVITGRTGHAEVVQIAFDPFEINFGEILKIFFHVHDPTTPNRQGADVGTQYRSVVFYHNEQQEKIAQEIITEIESSGLWRDPVVTEILPITDFYKAEEYHQNYYMKNPDQTYCTFVIEPKLKKLSEFFHNKY